MMNRLLLHALTAAACVSLILPVGSGAQRKPPRPVILVGIDGLSTDGLQYARTPVITGVIRRGCLSLTTRGVMPTVSAPNWSSMLLGAGPEQHGITSNSWSMQNHTVEPAAEDADGYFPSIFEVVRKQLPGAVTCAFFDWEMLGTIFNRKYADTVLCVSGTRNITECALRYILAKRPVFSFIYYGEPDEAGHEYGHMTPEYLHAIAVVDSEVGKIIRALQSANRYEETTILIVSDHGGVGKGHGGESMAEIEVPWIIAGPAVARDRLLELPNNTINTAPTIAYAMGLTQPQAWVGKPVAEAFDRTTKGGRYVPKPFSSLGSSPSLEPREVRLSSWLDGLEIRYTLDGSPPTGASPLYTGPIVLENSAQLRAVAMRGNDASGVTAVDFTRVPGVREFTLKTGPVSKYSAQGPLSLLDGRHAAHGISDRRWLGFEGDDIEATIDFGAPRSIRKVTVGCLRQEDSWVFLPAAIEIYASSDGETFRVRKILAKGEISVEDGNGPRVISLSLEESSARFVRVVVRNTGILPAGHTGAGKKAWLFVDEIGFE